MTQYRHFTGRRSHRDAVVRAVGIVAAVTLVVVTLSDFWTDFWVAHPMVTANVSALLLLIVGVAVVNEYLAARTRRQWETVAALAVTQLRDQIRITIEDLAGAVGVPSADPRSHEVRATQSDDPGAVAVAVAARLDDPAASDAVLERLSRHLDDAQAMAREWAPVMVNESQYAGRLDAYVDILNRVWRLVWALSPEERGDRPPPPSDAVAEEYAAVVDDALTLDADLTASIRSLLPWPESFGPPPSTWT
ncbi:MAG: hypothetical protein U0R64_00600 [Candidatus Nanopelagicales bacterium]